MSQVAQRTEYKVISFPGTKEEDSCVFKYWEEKQMIQYINDILYVTEQNVIIERITETTNFCMSADGFPWLNRQKPRIRKFEILNYYPYTNNLNKGFFEWLRYRPHGIYNQQKEH